MTFMIIPDKKFNQSDIFNTCENRNITIIING